MKISFYERKADRYEDGTWEKEIKESNLRDYIPIVQNYFYQENIVAVEGSTKRITNIRIDGKSYKTPSVFFHVKSTSPSYSNEKVCLYWIKELNKWVGISEYWEMENNHPNPWSECHSGPFKVGHILADKLLGAYNLDKNLFIENDVSKISPFKLEGLASKNS